MDVSSVIFGHWSFQLESLAVKRTIRKLKMNETCRSCHFSSLSFWKQSITEDSYLCGTSLQTDLSTLSHSPTHREARIIKSNHPSLFIVLPPTYPNANFALPLSVSLLSFTFHPSIVNQVCNRMITFHCSSFLVSSSPQPSLLL